MFGRNLVALLALCMSLLLVAAQAAPVPDVRVVVDISGSMKKNDPQNLRVPAVRLLVSLLPQGTQAGIWTFGALTNMLVKHGPVDAQWKKAATKAAGDIKSVAMFTNLEEALKRSTRDWKEPDPATRRHLIVLTDGMVDVSKDASENEQSRARIIDTLIPKLKKSGAQVHTIALSEYADHELMQKLSLATDGWNEQVASADMLQRIFLHLFEKAAPPDTLPLSDNRFKVDEGIREVTLLVFRKPGSEVTRLEAPNGIEVTQASGYSTLQWHHEDAFDMITIQEPIEGEWEIIADVDPDNRAMVVTDLKIEVTELPNNVSLGEEFEIETRVLRDGEVVTEPQFLELVEVYAEQISANGEQSSLPLKLVEGSPSGKQGVFSATMSQALVAGHYEVIFSVDGGTFQREVRQTVLVQPIPITVKVDRIDSPRWRGHQVWLSSDFELIAPESMRFDVSASDGTGAQFDVAVTSSSDRVWELNIPDSIGQGDLNLTIDVRGENVRGRPFEVRMERIVLERGGLAVVPIVTKGEAEPAAKTPQEEPMEMEADTEASDGDMIGMIALGVANLLLLGGAGLGFWMWRKGQKETDFGLEESVAT
ncbi:MAG TPA: VWA domain-containing protein [Chromatiales bacterium]|nr:VWA domain-containing protein [Chromatiales bacterium]